MSPVKIGSLGDNNDDNDSGRRNVQNEIHTLVTTNPVVLFMKGTPQQPMCGFSRAAAAIVQQYVDDFVAVNVLGDHTIREGVKVYSDWPTIPQLYVKGEFIGGSDILAEMHQKGQLRQLFG